MSPLARVRNWWAASIARRLTLGLIVALAVSIGVLWLLAQNVADRTLKREHEAAATRLAQVFEASLHNAMLGRDLPGITHILETMGQTPGIEQARLLHPSGEVRFASRADARGQQDAAALQGLCLTAGCAVPPPRLQWQTAAGHSDAQLQVQYPIANQARCAQCHGTASAHPVNGVLLIDFQPLSAQADTTASHGDVWALLGVALTALSVFAALMALTLRRVVTQPLAALGRAAGQLAANSAGDGSALSTRVGGHGPDEVGRLRQDFDRMAERLQASMASLQAQQHFLQQLVDAMPDPVLVIDPQFRIRLANRAYAVLLGLDETRIAGACCHRIGRGLDEPCPSTLVSCPVVELRGSAPSRLPPSDRHNPASVRSVMSLKHTSGRDVPVDIEAAALWTGGEALTVQVLRPLDRSVRFSQEQRLSTIGLLANGVAHEIHNPLASIRLALQACLRGLKKQDISEDELVEYLQLVDREIDRCVLTTQRLLQMSQPPGATLLPVSLHDAATDVLTLLGTECQQAHVTTQLHITPQNLHALGDGAELRQVLVNLVHNALHAMPRGGRIDVSAQCSGDEVTVTVADTGQGIAPDNLSRVFLPFFSHRADGQRGMGLGLAISKSIVERFGGRISVHSQVGVGTTFTLHLKVADAHAQTPPPITPASAPTAPPSPPPPPV